MHHFSFLTTVLTAVCLISSVTAAPVASAFTFQGLLTDSVGKPLSGSYDLSFKLFDAETAGTQIGGTVTLTGVTVKNGVFSVRLDFGATPFAGDQRWVEVGVGGEAMTPRSEITSSPYATYALSVPWTGVTGAPLSLPPSGSAGGDLTGTYPNPAVAENAITGTKIADGTVALEDLALNSVDSGKVTDESLTSPDLAVDANSLAKVSGGVMRSAGLGISIGTDILPGGPFQVYGPVYKEDQAQLSSNTSLGGETSIWQSFTAGISGTLTAIEADVFVSDESFWTKTLAIRVGEGTNGDPLTSQTVSGRGSGLRTYVLETPVPVVEGNRYTFHFFDGTGVIRIRTTSTNAYPGGICCDNPAYDAVFRTLLADIDSLPALVISPGTLNVGIQNTLPPYPLSFASVEGDKISLSGPAGNHFGFGIRSGAMQIHSDGSGTDIAFGYGRSDSFTELARIRGNGNFGIGTKTPATRLEVAGTARIAGFQLGTSASAGQVLTADTTGTGTWQTPPASLPPSGPAGGDLAGTYPNPVISANAVNSACIEDGTVGLADLATNSVNSGKIVDSSVALADMSAGSVDSTKIVDESVASGDLALDAYSLAKVSGGVMTSSGGKIGIGVTSPVFPLSFPDTAGDKISLFTGLYGNYGFGIQDSLLQVFTDRVTGDIAFGYGSSALFTETVRIKGSGQVGIGTSAPVVPLAIGDSDTGLGSGGAGVLKMVADNTDTVIIRPSNVGISSPNPKDALDVVAHPVFAAGEYQDQAQLTATAYYGIPSQGASYGQSFTVGMTGTLTKLVLGMGTQGGAPWSATLTLYNGEGVMGPPLASISISGNTATYYTFAFPLPPSVQIGQVCTWAVSNVNSLVDVGVYYNKDGSGYPRGNMYRNGLSNPLLDFYFQTLVTVTAGANQDHALLVRDDTGNVGIGTMTPGYKLHVKGTLAASDLPSGDYSNIQWNPNTGQFYQDTSSIRYKENITPLADDFGRLLQAEPKTYTRPGNPDRWEIGYIAEDIDALGLSKLVEYKDGQPDGLNYQKMVLYLTEIAKSQKATIEDQQRQIDDLKAAFAALKSAGKP